MDWLGRIRAAIEADGRSLRAISVAAGLGPNYVSEMIGKKKVPAVDKLLRLCRELKVSATFILTGADISGDSEEMLSLLGKLSVEEQATVQSLVRQLAAARQ